MPRKSLKKHVDSYIERINRLLPYNADIKAPVLGALREEVMDALTDAGSSDPTTVYGTPRDVAKNVSLGQDWGVRASYKRRTLAYILDLIICFVVSALLAAFFTPIYLDVVFPGIFPEILEVIPPSESYIAISLIITSFLTLLFFINLLLSFFYFIGLERAFATTLGKAVLRLKVCDVSGVRITLRQSIIRNFSKTSALFLVFDIILGRAIKEGEQQRVLDLFAETVVLKI